MKTISLFGMDLPVKDKSGKVDGPKLPSLSFSGGGFWDAEISPWNGAPPATHKLTLKTLFRCKPAGASRTVWFGCDLILECTENQGRYGVITSPQVQPHNSSHLYLGTKRPDPDDTGDRQLLVQLGIFFGKQDLSKGNILGDETGFSFMLPGNTLLGGGRLPVSATYARAGIALFLPGESLLLRERAFTGTVGVRVPGPKKTTTFIAGMPVINCESYVPINDLLNERGSVALVEDPTSGGAGVPLQADINPANNCIAIPAFARHGQLRLGLLRTGDSNSLESAAYTVNGTRAGAVIESRTYANSHDRSPLTLALTSSPDGEGTDSGIKLKVRLDAVTGPSTFLIAETGPITFSCSTSAFFGVVPGAQFTSSGQAQLTCDHVVPPASLHLLAPEDQISAALLADASFPKLGFPGEGRIAYPLPGDSYVPQRANQSNDAVTWSFNADPAQGFFLPVQPLELMRLAAGGNTPGDNLVKFINDHATRTFKADSVKVRHEGFAQEDQGDQDIRIQTLLPTGHAVGAPLTSDRPGRAAALTGSDTGDRDRNADLHVATFSATRQYGPFEVELTYQGDKPPPYIILRKNRKTGAIAQYPKGADSWIATGHEEFKIKAHTTKAMEPERILGIVKLDQTITINDIFTREALLNDPGFPPMDGRETFLDRLDGSVRSRTWAGLLLIDLPVDLGSFPVLEDTIGTDLTLQYLSIGGDSGVADRRSFSYSGRVHWSNTAGDIPVPPSSADEEENVFTMRSLDVTFRDNEINYFRSVSEVTFLQVGGMSSTNRDETKEPPLLTLIGSYNRRNKEFKFISQLAKPLPVFLKGQEIGPIKQLYVSSAMLTHRGGSTQVLLEGQVDLRPFTFAGVTIDVPEAQVFFQDFGLTFPSAPQGGKVPQWLRFNYPSFKINADFPQFQLFDQPWLQLKIQSLGVVWKNSTRRWGHLLQVHNNLETIMGGGGLTLDLRLNIGKMPDLIVSDLKELMLDLTVGFGFKGGAGALDPGKLAIGFRAVGFHKFEIDIMRFLRMKAESLSFGREDINGHNVKKATIKGLELDVLNTPILKGLDFYWFAPDDTKSKSLLAFYPSTGNGPDLGLLKVHWFLIGKNLYLPENLAKDIISIDTPDKVHDHENRIANAIKDAVDRRTLVPANTAQPNRVIGEWIFAAGFDFLSGFIVGKFLFQDKAYYGIALRGAMLKDWFGYDFAFAVLFIKGDVPEEDSYYIEVRVPKVAVGSFMFTGGVIALEIGVGGNFMLDMGFPWLGAGGRQWNRTFGAIMTPLQGAGGSYMTYARKHNSGDLIAGGGLALMAGVGASFSAGPFHVWVRAGYYAVLEGAMRVAPKDKEVVALRVVGAVGVLVEGAGELNWWIISARVGIRASAEARATVMWAKRDNLEIYDTDPKYKTDALTVRLDFELRASASARACIGSGPFKVCKGISASVSMGFTENLVLGN